MRISRDIGQELDKLEQSVDQDDKLNKKLSNNFNNNTYCNKSSLVKKNNENKNYIYHKKHKSINTSFIPFPSSTKNAENIKNNRLLDKKQTSDNNKNNKNILSKFSKNNFNKHRRFLSTSENEGNNYANHLYSSNTTNHTNNSNLNFLNNSNNLFMNSLSNKNKQRNSQRKVNNNIDINILKTDKNKENININNITSSNYNTNNLSSVIKEKKKENKIPFNLVKKRNSANENAFKKKIPVNKNTLINSKDNQNLGMHKKSMSLIPENNNGFLSVRPKSTKQIVHLKNSNNISSYKVGINKDNPIVNIIKKKENSINKTSRPTG